MEPVVLRPDARARARLSAEGKANWCTGCQTVIANEQVVDEDRCERCGSQVVERIQPEWAFRITAYAQQLLDGLDRLPDWPERVTTMQRNWIGRSDGAEVDFALPGVGGAVKVFTTRVDTIHGCTYVVLAPEHPLVAWSPRRSGAPRWTPSSSACARPTRSSAPARARRRRASSPAPPRVNPYTGEAVPIWIANFVLAEYGTGAVMSVPAHDQRDFEFARKYGLPVRVVIQPAQGERLPAGDALERAFTADGVLEGSGPFTGLASAAARAGMAALARSAGLRPAHRALAPARLGLLPPALLGHAHPDRLLPGARGGAGAGPGPLPVVLPPQAIITGTGEPPLAKVPEFVNTTCPRCGKPARREVETMDTFVDSSWYYARYLSPHDDARPFDPEMARRWLPVDVYVGGPEHAVMHLLYFRFWHRVMQRARPGAGGRAGPAAGHPGHRERPRRPEDVEALGQRGRARAHRGAIRRGHRPALHALRRPAREGHRLVRRAGGRALPVPGAGVARLPRPPGLLRRAGGGAGRGDGRLPRAPPRARTGP